MTRNLERAGAQTSATEKHAQGPHDAGCGSVAKENTMKQINNPVIVGSAPRVQFTEQAGPALKWPKRSGGPTAAEPRKPWGNNIVLATMPERNAEIVIDGKTYTVQGSCSLYVAVDDPNGAEVIKAVQSALTKAGVPKKASAAKRAVDENSKAANVNLSLLDEAA